MSAPFAIHHHGQVIGRSSGRSATAAAAYRTGLRIVDERTGEIHDYTRKRGVVFAETLIPDHAPRSFADASNLWNAVELSERNANAQLCREFDIAFDRGMNRDQNIALAREYVMSVFVSKGMCVTWAYHDPDGANLNPHMHVMCTMREVLPDGSFAPKTITRYLCRDSHGEERELTSGEFKELKSSGWEKVYQYKGGKQLTQSEAKEAGLNPTKDRTRKQPINRDAKPNDWDDEGNMEKWREVWSNALNTHLKRARVEKSYDHRSFERRGIAQIPQVHLGVEAKHMEERGVESARGEKNRQIETMNDILRDETLPVEVRQEVLERGYEMRSQHFENAAEVYEHARPVFERVSEFVAYAAERVNDVLRRAVDRVLANPLCRSMAAFIRDMQNRIGVDVRRTSDDVAYVKSGHAVLGRELGERYTLKALTVEFAARSREATRTGVQRESARAQMLEELALGRGGRGKRDERGAPGANLISRGADAYKAYSLNDAWRASADIEEAKQNATQRAKERNAQRAQLNLHQGTDKTDEQRRQEQRDKNKHQR